MAEATFLYQPASKYQSNSLSLSYVYYGRKDASKGKLIIRNKILMTFGDHVGSPRTENNSRSRREGRYQREKSFSITECTYDIEGGSIKTETGSTGGQHEHSHRTRSQGTQVDQRLPRYLGPGFLLFDFAALIL